MIMYYYIWLYMIIYDYIWLYMIIYDYIWSYMIIYDYILYYSILYYIIVYYIILYHIITYCIISYYNILYYTILLCYVIWYYVLYKLYFTVSPELPFSGAKFSDTHLRGPWNPRDWLLFHWSILLKTKDIKWVHPEMPLNMWSRILCTNTNDQNKDQFQSWPWLIHRHSLITAWWLIPLSKWVITPVINGISRVNPLIIGVITHLLSGMSHQVDSSLQCCVSMFTFSDKFRKSKGSKALNFGQKTLAEVCKVYVQMGPSWDQSPGLQPTSLSERLIEGILVAKPRSSATQIWPGTWWDHWNSAKLRHVAHPAVLKEQCP